MCNCKFLQEKKNKNVFFQFVTNIWINDQMIIYFLKFMTKSTMKVT
jgi:hypothetical protein